MEAMTAAEQHALFNPDGMLAQCACCHLLPTTFFLAGCARTRVSASSRHRNSQARHFFRRPPMALNSAHFALPAALCVLSVGDKNTVKKICESFLKRSVDSKNNIIKSSESKNYVDLRRHAHSLKGACGYVCSDQLKNSSLTLQLACDAVNKGEGDVAAIETAMDTVLKELDIVLLLIAEHIEAPPP